jgi:protein SCO1/2
MNRAGYHVLLIIIVLGLGANWVIEKANNSHDIPILKPVPQFSFFNQRGEPFTNENLEFKVTILDFMFTSCAGPCPMMTLNMSNLYKDFDDVKEVQFVSITVDPVVDTQEKLREYAELIGVDDGRWQFLWSDMDAIKDLKKNGFMLFADDLPQGHAIKFVLIDHKGNIRKYFDGTDEASQKVLRKDIANLVKESRS